MKFIYKAIAVLAFIVLICFLLMIPPVAAWVSSTTGIAAQKIRGLAITVAGTAIGLLLVSFGVTALTVPVVGIVLIGVGIALVAYSLWPLLTNKSASTATLGDAGLQSIVR